MSGGGSRAALFGAAGLEELAKIPIPNGTSVLGASVLYLQCLRRQHRVQLRPRQTAPGQRAGLAPDGSMSAEYRAFFERYRSRLSQDFETPLIWRQVGSFRWVNSALAAQSLVRDSRGEAVRGRRGYRTSASGKRARTALGLIINTTLYNNGRRLAVTTLPPGALRYDFFQDFQASLARRGLQDHMPPRL